MAPTKVIIFGTNTKKDDSSRIPVGARLFPFRKYWRGAAHEGIVRIGLSWSWKKSPPALKRLRQKRSKALNRFIKELRKKRVIEKAKRLRCQSLLFTVPKRTAGEHRLILDLSELNKFIECPSFKMLTLKEVKLLLPQGYWTVAIDMRDGYWHVPVAPSKRPFLGFTYNGQDWQFRAMPFGLNVAPRAFTKVMSHVISVLAKAGIWVLPYLDDLLIIADSEESCRLQSQKALHILKTMGLLINETKSRLQPAQKFEWLGVQWDLSSHRAQVTPEKIMSLKENIISVIKAKSCTVRDIQRIQGLANWIAQFDPIIRLLLSTTRQILKLNRHSTPNGVCLIPINHKIRLCSWIRGEPFPQALGVPAPDITIQTDASLKGWGFQINQKRFFGKFDKTLNYSINVLELMTVWFALLVTSRKNVVIQVLCDNTTTIQVLKKGGSLNFQLASLAEMIWRRAALLNWTLQIAHIGGAFNVLADQLSRNEALSTEWSLTRRDFQDVLRLNPRLQVDLFATSLNNKLQTFVSPCPDPQAAAVDALTISWEKWNHLYLYPPSPLISRVLGKLKKTSYKSAVLLTPETPTRPWYMALKLQGVHSTLMEVRLQQVVIDRVVIHPHNTKLRAWLLSGQHISPDSHHVKQH